MTLAGQSHTVGHHEPVSCVNNGQSSDTSPGFLSDRTFLLLKPSSSKPIKLRQTHTPSHESIAPSDTRPRAPPQVRRPLVVRGAPAQLCRIGGQDQHYCAPGHSANTAGSRRKTAQTSAKKLRRRSALFGGEKWRQ